MQYFKDVDEKTVYTLSELENDYADCSFGRTFQQWFSDQMAVNGGYLIETDADGKPLRRTYAVNVLWEGCFCTEDANAVALDIVMYAIDNDLPEALMSPDALASEFSALTVGQELTFGDFTVSVIE